MAMLLVRELQTEDFFEKVRHDEGVANAAAHMIRSISSRTAAVMKGFGQSRNEGVYGISDNKEEARGGNSIIVEPVFADSEKGERGSKKQVPIQTKRRNGMSTGPASTTARHDLFEECLVMCEVGS